MTVFHYDLTGEVSEENQKFLPVMENIVPDLELDGDPYNMELVPSENDIHDLIKAIYPPNKPWTWVGIFTSTCQVKQLHDYRRGWSPAITYLSATESSDISALIIKRLTLTTQPDGKSLVLQLRLSVREGAHGERIDIHFFRL